MLPDKVWEGVQPPRVKGQSSVGAGKWNFEVIGMFMSTLAALLLCRHRSAPWRFAPRGYLIKPRSGARAVRQQRIFDEALLGCSSAGKLQQGTADG